jgi:hypothetical protein
VPSGAPLKHAFRIKLLFHPEAFAPTVGDARANQADAASQRGSSQALGLMFRHVATAAMFLGSFTAAAADKLRVSMNGYGLFRIGMSERQAAQASGHQLVRLYPGNEQRGCFYVSAPQLPEGVSLMFRAGHLARVDIFEPEVATISGAKIGTSERQLDRMYGRRLDQKPHKYDWPVGHYFTLLSSDRSLGIRFETDGTHVTGYYAGTAAAIELAEGCQ